VAFGDFYFFTPQVSAAARRALAARQLAMLRKKGRTVTPVEIDGRTIARTFWGKAWCDNLERYSDYANRLPRGRSYVRHGSVVDLQVSPGRVTALVSGSSLYDVTITVAAVPRARWSAMCKDCAGAIDSLVELLQGRLSTAVMTRLCQEKTGLFPSPKDLVFACSCPDWASMCKHVAAVLYGIGARLDHQPELLFTLRQVEQQDLIADAGAELPAKARRPASTKVLAIDDLSEMFGIDIAPGAKPKVATARSSRRAPVPTPSKRTAAGAAAKHRVASGKATAIDRKVKVQATPTPSGSRRSGMSAGERAATSERMRRYWAARRLLGKK
jgi:uncharacterized Zn finger protein